MTKNTKTPRAFTGTRRSRCSEKLFFNKKRSRRTECGENRKKSRNYCARAERQALFEHIRNIFAVSRIYNHLGNAEEQYARGKIAYRRNERSYFTQFAQNGQNAEYNSRNQKQIRKKNCDFMPIKFIWIFCGAYGAKQECLMTEMKWSSMRQHAINGLREI